MIKRVTARGWVLLAVAALNLPFVFQAYHIDDRIYLEVAEQIEREFFFPYDYPVVFEGIVSPDAASHSHLPLTAYYLAFVGWLTGSQAEWVMHLAFLIFPLLAAWAFYDIARRYVRFPAAASLLLALAPCFFILGHTLMADVPLLAAWLATLAAFFRWCERPEDARLLAVTAVALLAASFMSLLSAGLMMLMAAWWVLAGWKGLDRPPPGRLAALLALPALLWGVWYVRAWLHYDRMVLFNTVLHMGKRGAFESASYGWKMLSFTLNLGATFFFPVALAYAWGRRWSARLTLLLFFLLLVPFALGFEDWTWTQALLFATFFSCGLLTLYGLFRVPFKLPGCKPGLTLLSASDFKPSAAKGHSAPSLAAPAPPVERQEAFSAFCFLWFLGVLAMALGLYYAGAARYVLPAAPPVILLWVKVLECRIRNNDYLLRNLVWLAFAATLPYSLWLAWGDYRYADMYRQAAREVAREYSAPGTTIWHTTEWGLRYYLEREGARVLARSDSRPAPGDIIVKPRVAPAWRTVYDDPSYLELVEVRRLDMPTSLRIIDFKSRAAFYSTGWGILPFSLGSQEEWERLAVFRVKRRYDGPLPEPERHW